MGFPDQASKKALIQTENKGIEEAVEQILKNMDMDDVPDSMSYKKDL